MIDGILKVWGGSESDRRVPVVELEMRIAGRIDMLLENWEAKR